MAEWLEWVREHWLGLAAAVLALGLGLAWLQAGPVSQPPGVLVPEDPHQAEPASREPWTFRNHRITPLAAFDLRARVLSTERYRFDRASQLSPVDLALGWGPMSDTRILEAFSIRQRDRWYFWRSARMPIPEAEVIAHSANMHLIPATPAVAKRILAIRPGQVVELHGQLIRADGPDGWHWVSSLSRTDTGEGSCEVVWVESARLADRAERM
jgi:hypothetical protein